MDKKIDSLISIIVPSYNASEYIADLIESVIAQSYNNWELILVDDWSKDTTYEIIKKYENIDQRIKGFRRPSTKNKGGNICRNYGFSKAKGNFIIFIDADDLLAPYCLSQRVKSMSRDANLDFGVFPALSFKKDPLDYNVLSHGYKTSNRALNSLVNKALPFVVWNNIYRYNSLIENNIIWDEKLLSNQDADFNIQCIIKGLQFKEFDVLPDYFWRQLPSSISKRIGSVEHVQSNLYYFNKIISEFYNKEGFSRDIKIFTLWMFNVIIRSKVDSGIAHFLENSYLKEYGFFYLKLKFITPLIKIIIDKCPQYYTLIKTIIFPYLSLLSRKFNGEFPFHKTKQRRISYLVNKYQEYQNNLMKNNQK